jgi:Ca-activated chloride channel family protein
MVTGAPGASTSPAPGAPPVFRVNVDTVPLTVTVTHAVRGYVGNLGRDDFTVFDNGVRQQVTIFEHGDVPLDLLLLIDVSASVYHQFHLVQSAGKGFLGTLRAGDRAAVVGFNDQVRLLADWTADRARLHDALDGAQAGGSTALYTALYVALRGLDPDGHDDGHTRRRAIVVLSDGMDTESLMTYDGVVDACRRTNVTVYTIRLAEPAPSLFGRLTGRRHDRTPEFVMTNVARETGGRAFSIRRLDELAGVYEQIARELASQYLLGYVPTGADDHREFHTVAVTLPEYPGVLARTRMGYLTTAQPRRAGTR